jgi:hypothetical protein
MEKIIKVVLSNTSTCPVAGAKSVNTTSSVTVNGIKFTKEQFAEPGMNQMYATTRYTIVRDGSCFGLDFILHTGNYAAVYKGTNTPVPQNYSDAETKVFDEVLSTFKLTQIVPKESGPYI